MLKSAHPSIKPQPCHLCGAGTIEGCVNCELPCCERCECDCTDGMAELEMYQDFKGETMHSSRRGFIKTIVSMWMLATAMGSAVWLQACSAADVLADITAYIPVGIAGITNLLNLLGSLGIIPLGVGTAAAAVLATISGLFATVKATITEYQQLVAAGTPNPSLLVKIQDLLQSISDNIANFVAPLKISDSKIVQLIGALLSLILTTLAGFMAALAKMAGTPTATAAAKVRRTIAMQSGSSLVVEAKYRTASQFESQYNKLMDGAGHQESEIH